MVLPLPCWRTNPIHCNGITNCLICTSLYNNQPGSGTAAPFLAELIFSGTWPGWLPGEAFSKAGLTNTQAEMKVFLQPPGPRLSLLCCAFLGFRIPVPLVNFAKTTLTPQKRRFSPFFCDICLNFNSELLNNPTSSEFKYDQIK